MRILFLSGPALAALAAASPAAGNGERLPSGADLKIADAPGEPAQKSEVQSSVVAAAPSPARLIVTSPFGRRTDPIHGRTRHHAGVDLPGHSRARIYATGAGQVRYAGWRGGYGQCIEIDHGGGLSTRYAHLAEIAVRPGQIVNAGAVIGRMGSTGRSTGTHLHYEVRLNGVAVDPMRFASSGHSGFQVDRVKWAAERRVTPRWSGWASSATTEALPQARIK